MILKNIKNMTAEIEKYIEIQNNIDEILKNSPFKKIHTGRTFSNLKNHRT